MNIIDGAIVFSFLGLVIVGSIYLFFSPRPWGVNEGSWTKEDTIRFDRTKRWNNLDPWLRILLVLSTLVFLVAFGIKIVQSDYANDGYIQRNCCCAERGD